MEDLAKKAIDAAQKSGAEFVDLRLESTLGTNIVVMDGKTRNMSAQRESGCGIRAFVGGAWGFSATNDLSTKSLKSAAEAAVRMAKVARSKAKIEFRIADGKAVRRTEKYRCKERPSDITVDEKLAFVLSLDKQMRSHGSRISSTNVRYDDLEAERLVANSFGSLVRASEKWVLSGCSAWARTENLLQRGHASEGSVGGYELMRKEVSQNLGNAAAEQALRLLDSRPVPAGKFTVILDNKMTGMLAHEAFGHACEADGILGGSSVLADRLGQKVANEGITMVDDPTLEDTFGHFSFDWEGVKAKKNVLIADGVLTGFMHNIESSSRMGLEPTGSARAQAYNSPPIIRMSNTYIAPGKQDKDELFEGLKRGLMIQGNQYGYVEPAKGQFMFKCDEVYEIVNGEVGQRFRDASISGLILEVLKNVEGIANDFVLGDPGYCGKGGQSARTAEGGPHLRVANMVVGGLA